MAQLPRYAALVRREGRQRLCRQMKVSHTVAFLDEEVHWENVRVLPNGEAVSPDGTHLGHNLVRDCEF